MFRDPHHITIPAIQGRYRMRPDPAGKLDEIAVAPRSVRPEPGSNERAS